MASRRQRSPSVRPSPGAKRPTSPDFFTARMCSLTGRPRSAAADGQLGVFDAIDVANPVVYFFNTRYFENGVDGLTIASVSDTATAEPNGALGSPSDARSSVSS